MTGKRSPTSPEPQPPREPESPREPETPREPRPWIERIGMALVALVMALLFGFVAVAAFAGGEYFLAAMGLVGCMMTLAVGGITLLRG